MVHFLADDLDHPHVIALLELHLRTTCANTAPDSAHALDLSGLRGPAISFWSMWEDVRLIGIGALKRLTADHGEVKSMRVVESMRGRGFGRRMLDHLIATAHAQGMTRLSLETGSWDYFQPARALYRRCGFSECAPFADYIADPNSVFMTLEIDVEALAPR